MRQFTCITSLLFSIFLAFSFRFFSPQTGWIQLFNGKNLDGWDTWIGPPLDNSGKKLSEIPVGLNNDPDHVFTVVDQNDEKLIRISGEKWGGISTKAEFENFHLQLMFKWGTLSWGQKKGKKKDSGLLYFAVGEHGADYGAWMRSQEFQIQETDCGDYWGVAGGVTDIPAIKKSDSEYVYHPQGQLYSFNANNKIGRHCIKAADAEKPTGEWNTLDLYCHRDTSVHMINGKLMMILYNSRQWENGKESPLLKGKLQIQSEGAEIFYKQIRLRSISAIPTGVLK
jgi:3-keto-disaccharide hydrolase